MSSYCIFLLFITCYFRAEAASSVKFPIGGLFNQYTNENSKKAFDAFSRRKDILSANTIYSNVRDTYSTALTVCDATRQNGTVMALIDPRPSYGICDTTCLLCNKYNISYLSLGWQPPESNGLMPSYIFNYHPSPELVSRAHAALIKHLQWDRFTILYEDEEGFLRMQEIINTWAIKGETIIYKKLNPKGDNRETFKYLLKEACISYHVLDCHVDNIVYYMKQIVDVDNTTEYQSIILTSLDAYMLELNIPQLKANISVLHLNLANDPRWLDAGIDESSIRLETALAADAVDHVAKAIRNLQYSENYDDQDTRSYTAHRDYGDVPALCLLEKTEEYEGLSWVTGEKLRDSLRNTTISGFTGNIEFDEQGLRQNFVFHYSKLDNTSRFRHHGTWKSRTNAFFIDDDFLERSSLSGTDRPIMVVSRQGVPYFEEYIEDGEKKFRGYAVDLVDAIFKFINRNQTNKIQHKFYRVSNDDYGNYNNATKKWTGLIGDLLEHKADMAVCDLTITSERNLVVEFSVPFMSLGISMLFKKPEAEPPDWFSFINPLSADMWLYLCFTYVIISFILLICARMCQSDWVNPHPCNRSPESLQNIWDLYNCMWLTMGSIMTQGCDILPRAAGTRFVTGMWWFFALIITSSYTANMSTFLSNDRRSTDIANVKELSEQTQIIYGTVQGATTYKFFKNSKDPVYSKIASSMESAKPSVFERNNDEGKDRVIRSKGKYVFFMESSAIEYYTQRNPDLKMVGPKLDSKEYGIAMPRNFPQKKHVNSAILNLQETNQLEDLKKKWWAVENENNDNIADTDDSGSLEMKNSCGIFLVLGIGGVLGLIVAVIDFILHAHKIAVKEKVSFREALASEWRESLNPRSLNKATAPPRSAHPSPSVSPQRDRSASRAVSVLRAATSFINFDEIY